MAIRPVREPPARIGAAPAAIVSRTARDAAAAIAGPALRAVLRGDDDSARDVAAGYDDETLDALTAAADHLSTLCQEIRGRRS